MIATDQGRFFARYRSRSSDSPGRSRRNASRWHWPLRGLRPGARKVRRVFRVKVVGLRSGRDSYLCPRHDARPAGCRHGKEARQSGPHFALIGRRAPPGALQGQAPGAGPRTGHGTRVTASKRPGAEELSRGKLIGARPRYRKEKTRCSRVCRLGRASSAYRWLRARPRHCRRNRCRRSRGSFCCIRQLRGGLVRLLPEFAGRAGGCRGRGSGHFCHCRRKGGRPA
jgi:hypothetical protein